MPNLRRILIAYDVPQDRRRTRLANVLASYGDRVQYSVFVADLTPVRIARLRRAIGKVIEDDQDSVLICDLGPSIGADGSRFQYIGQQRPITNSDSFVV